MQQKYKKIEFLNNKSLLNNQNYVVSKKGKYNLLLKSIINNKGINTKSFLGKVIVDFLTRLYIKNTKISLFITHFLVALILVLILGDISLVFFIMFSFTITIPFAMLESGQSVYILGFKSYKNYDYKSIIDYDSDTYQDTMLLSIKYTFIYSLITIFPLLLIFGLLNA